MISFFSCFVWRSFFGWERFQLYDLFLVCYWKRDGRGVVYNCKKLRWRNGRGKLKERISYELNKAVELKMIWQITTVSMFVDYRLDQF